MARIFVEGWDPEYGTPLDQDEALAPAEGSVDPTVETDDWERRSRASTTASSTWRSSTASGGSTPGSRSTIRSPGPTPGLVRDVRGRRHPLGPARAVAPRSPHVRIERWAVLAGGRDEQMPAGRRSSPAYGTTTCASDDPGASDDGAPHEDAPRRGRDRRPRSPPSASWSPTARSNDLTAHPTVGYMKSHRVTYLAPDHNAVVAQLAPGQRTPLFCIADYNARTPGTCGSRCCDGGHSWTGSCGARRRGSCPRTTPSRSPIAPPRCCRSSRSEPHVDPRAPQNLVPIGALETELRHRMGDRGLVYRALREAVMAARHRAGGLVTDERQVGRVLGSEHSNTSAFRVVLDDDEFLQLDDLVVVRTQVPKAGEVRTYGVVTEAEAVYEGASYESDTHRIAELGIMPAAKVRTAQRRGHARRPRGVGLARPGRDRWSAPTGDERDKALYVDEMGRPLPDRHRPRRAAGRTSISTSSTDARAATCRSAASAASPPRPRSRCSSCACSRRIRRVVGEGAANLRVLVFNVKGEDLLWLDKPNRLFDERGRRGLGRARRRARAVPQRVLLGAAEARVRRRARARHRRPPRGRRGLHLDARASSSTRTCCSSCFTDANDQRNQIPFIRERVQAQLQAVRGRRGGQARRGRAARPSRRAGRLVARPAGQRRGRASASSPTSRRWWTRSASSWSPRTAPSPTSAWSGRVMGGTVSAFMRRLHAGASRMGHLGARRRVAIASTARAPASRVVAIQSLHDQAQRFVVGALLNETFAEKEATGQRLPLSVVVLDELNKYAPREGTRPAEGDARSTSPSAAARSASCWSARSRPRAAWRRRCSRTPRSG